MKRPTFHLLGPVWILALALGFVGLGSAAVAENEGQCANFYAEIGKPVDMSEESDTIELCHMGYLANYNLDTKVANWVVERLDGDRLRPRAVAHRDNSRFAGDPNLAEKLRVGGTAYKGSGYDRGHMAPAADMKWGQDAMNESFYMSNMAPQIGAGFNRNIWARLENEMRQYALATGDVIVITGPVYDDLTPTIGKAKIVVPDAFYKIVYDPELERAIGFLLPNKNLSGHHFSEYITPIREIEGRAGHDFLAKLPKRKQNLLELSHPSVWKTGS